MAEDESLEAALQESEPAEEGAEAEGGLLEAIEGMEAGMEDLADDEIDQLESEMLLASEGTPEGTPASPGDGGSPAPESDPEEELNDDVDVEQHLKDSVEGSLRLKRLLSRDDDEDGTGKKRRKIDGEAEKKLVLCKNLASRWQLVQDAVVLHVLSTCSLAELEELSKSNYCPDKYHHMKSPAELLARYTNEMKERKMPGGAACDVISAFKFRHKLDIKTDRALRALCHKDLRHVVATFDGTKPIEEVIKEAPGVEAEDDNTTENAIPSAGGVNAVGRFHRLELIDPLADCVIFGDANLTFALRLAKHRQALGHVGRLLCTTFEDLETLRERYQEIDESIKILEDMHAEVIHGVDCTRIALHPRFKGLENSFGAVYYNFPHSGAINGFFDGHPVVNWRHENLMRLFFRALRSFCKPGCIVKVASNMGAVGVRYSYIVGGGLENEFLHTETVPFLEWALHRYGRSYGDKRDVYKRPDAKNNQSYNAQNAERDMVYCFKYAPTGKQLGQQPIRLPPTLKTLKLCQDGPFKTMHGHSKDNLAKQLHKRFVTEVSGTHVG